MQDDELEEIAAKLEDALDCEKAESHLTTGKPFLWLTGTRDALLYLAAACLRAAASSIPNDDSRGNPSMLEHRQIADSKSDYVLGAVERIDGFPENPEVIAKRKRDAWRNDRGCLLGCGIAGLFLLFVLISGVMLWWGIVTGEHP